MSAPQTLADAAFALIVEHREGRTKLTERSGSFTGQLVAGMTGLSERQAAWLQTLLRKAGLPEVELEEVR